MCMQCSWISRRPAPLDPHRLREAVHTVVAGIRIWRPDSAHQFDEPVQVIPADPVAPWRYVDLSGSDLDFDEQVQAGVRGGTRRGLRPGRPAGVSGGVDPHRSRPASVCAHQSPHRARWLVAADPAGGNLRRLLRAAAARGRVVSQLCHLAGRSRSSAARAAWREVLAGFDTPTLVARPDRLELGRRGVAAFRMPEQTTRALGELARAHHTTVNIVLQGAWAQLLMWLTGQHDVAFGTAVSGRPTEVVGAESMVGLLINTVPVRARITAATTTARPTGPAAKRPQPHT